MNLAKKIFKCLGICALVCLIAVGWYEIWLIACAMIDSDNLFNIITGFLILLAESAMTLSLVIVLIQVVKIKWLGVKDEEDDEEDF